MVSGAMIPTAKKVGLIVGPASALIAPHTPSEETQTLKNKGLALTVPHDTSVQVSNSSMRDSRCLALTPYLISSRKTTGGTYGGRIAAQPGCRTSN